MRSLELRRTEHVGGLTDDLVSCNRAMANRRNLLSTTQPIIAIIPARGGSKRLPQKNLLPVAGVPLLTHSVRHAQHAKRVDHVFVSTDDADIAAAGEAAGAISIRRPASLATDEASSEDAILHAIRVVREEHGIDPGLVVFLQCTSPIRMPDDIDRAIAELEARDLDSIFSAVRFDKLIWTEQEGELQSLNWDYRHRKREQDMPHQYEESGSVYVTKPEIYERYRNRIGGRFGVCVCDFWTSRQVDSLEDLALVDWYLRRHSGGCVASA